MTAQEHNNIIWGNLIRRLNKPRLKSLLKPKRYFYTMPFVEDINLLPGMRESYSDTDSDMKTMTSSEYSNEEISKIKKELVEDLRKEKETRNYYAYKRTKRIFDKYDLLSVKFVKNIYEDHNIVRSKTK